MNSDIRVRTTFPHHHKTKKLRRKIGAEGICALTFIWLFAAENRPDGILSGMDEEDIAIAAQWDGDACVMLAALVDVGFLDKDESGYSIHGWTENNAWAAGATARSEKAIKAAKTRWDKRNGILAPEEDAKQGKTDAPSIGSDAPSNAPYPIPSPLPIPIPSLKQTLSATADVALEIILADETLQPITRNDVDDWIKLFPMVDVSDALARIRTTCIQNPAKRHNGETIRSHIVSCLKMMQERKDSFEGVWKRYPAKDGKKEAERHFRATVHTCDDLKDMHQALDRYLAVLESDPNRPPKNGSTWFNNWKDWVNWEVPQIKRKGSDDDIERALFNPGEKTQ